MKWLGNSVTGAMQMGRLGRQRLLTQCLMLAGIGAAPSVWAAQCDAPAWQEGSAYTAGAQVQFQGGLYQALVNHTAWVGSGWTPAVGSLWQPLDASACGGDNGGGDGSNGGDGGNNGGTDGGGDDGTDGGQCANLWRVEQVYTGGMQASWQGSLYEARWWTQGERPDSSGEWGVWKLVSATDCDGGDSGGNDGGGTDGGGTDGGGNDGGGTDGGGNDGGTDNGDDGVPDNIDLTGWPQPLGEFNRPYRNSSGSVVASYFVEWGVYGRGFHVANIPAKNLTHILYGFIPICGPNDSLREGNPEGYAALQRECSGKPDFSVTVHDRFAALEKSYPGDRWDDPIRGNFGQLMRMKASNPGIKILPSIGGWTLSDPFYHLANDSAKRATFVASVKTFLQTYSFFDGVDIDWEYPGGGGASNSLGGSADRAGYTALMRDLRAMLDQLSAETGRTYQLTSAVGAAPAKIAQVDYRQASQYMDYVFAMTYDFYGAWSGELGHHAGLYAASHAIHDGFNSHDALNNLLAAGVPANKLVMGVAMYGRGWNNISGGATSSPFAGTGGGKLAGTWEAGVLDYRQIEQRYQGGVNGQGADGFVYGYDDQAEAPYLWNPTRRELITYEDPRSAKAKADYARKQGLAGVFSWEIDADNGHILNAIHQGLGHPAQ